MVRCGYCDSSSHYVERCPVFGRDPGFWKGDPPAPAGRPKRGREEAAEPLPLSSPPSIPQDIFEVVVRRDTEKGLSLMALRSDVPVHVLYVGPPATAKTVFLSEIARLPGSYFALGTGAKKAGITKMLLDRRPRYLLIDEIDKLPREDQAALLSVMDTGVITETKGNRDRSEKVSCWVFAAGNDESKLSPELKSRFVICRMKPYTDEEMAEVMARVLYMREKADRGEALALARECVAYGFRDVRQAVSAWRMVRSGGGDAAEVVRLMARVSGGQND